MGLAYQAPRDRNCYENWAAEGPPDADNLDPLLDSTEEPGTQALLGLGSCEDGQSTAHVATSVTVKEMPDDDDDDDCQLLPEPPPKKVKTEGDTRFKQELV